MNNTSKKSPSGFVSSLAAATGNTAGRPKSPQDATAPAVLDSSSGWSRKDDPGFRNRNKTLPNPDQEMYVDEDGQTSPLPPRRRQQLSVEQSKVVMDRMRRRLETHQLFDSTVNYYKHDETIMFVDWDDTLCPSHWIKINRPILSYYNPPPNEPRWREPLEALSKKVIEFLRAANECGKVVIVTNASLGWINTACTNFLPEVGKVIQELKIPCEYARLGHEHESFQTITARSDGTFEYQYNADVPQNWKALSMHDQLTKYYSKYNNQSWKNVVSIGDQICEQEAAKSVVQSRPSRHKKCHVKTVKFIECPDISHLIDEVSALIGVLPIIAAFNGDMQYNIADDNIYSIVGVDEKTFAEAAASSSSPSSSPSQSPKATPSK